MKKFIGKHALALVLSLLIASAAMAQRPKHYVGGWLYMGYSAMFHNINYNVLNTNPDDILNNPTLPVTTGVVGGGGFGIGAGYQLRKGQFIFNTGLEFEFINSATSVKGLDGQARILDTEGMEALYKYSFSRFRDKQNFGLLNLPILAGMQFNGDVPIYFLAGAKVGVSVLGKYSSSGKMSSIGVYDRYIDPFENMPPHYYKNNHSFTNSQRVDGNKSVYSLINVMASAEVGIELNKYIFKQKSETDANGKKIRGAKNKKDKNAKEEPRIRVGLFADCGILNINGNKVPKGNDVLVRPQQGSDWFEAEGVIKSKLATENLLALDGAFKDNGKPKSVTPFIIGVKGTIFFDVTPAPKEKPKPPEPKPIPPPPPPILYITGKIIDVETAQEVKTATVEMFDVDKNNAKVFTAKPQYGVFNTKLNRKGTYKVNVTAPSYNAYSETFSNVGDTLMIYISPFKKSDRFIIHNIYFAFDKTDLIETSNLALDSLATFMKDNPGIKFKIIGHTDGDGTDAYNLRLSDGRAEQVMKALIARGIDASRLTFEGRGKREPLCPANDTPECKAENRRVEFEITDVE